MLAAELDQFGFDLWTRRDAGHELNGSFDFLAQVVVRHTEHRRVSDLRMRDEQVFAFLRIDVHTSGDDHEYGTVSQVQKAIFVEVANIANRAHRTIGREYLLRAFRVVEVLEARGQLEPHVAYSSGRAGIHIDVKNVNLAEQLPSDRALVRQPLGGIAGGDPHPLGRSVIFENDRPPPVYHLLFDKDRTGCRSMDRYLK